MNKITTILVVIIVALSFVLGTTMQSKAQQKSFPGTLPFVTSDDRVGFFDQSNGRIYLYDNNLTNCLFIGEIQSLGDPIKAIPSGSGNTSSQDND